MKRLTGIWRILLMPVIVIWHYAVHHHYDQVLSSGPDPAGDGCWILRGCSRCGLKLRFDYPNLEIHNVPDHP